MTLTEFKERILKAYPGATRIKKGKHGFAYLYYHHRSLSINMSLFPEIDFSEPIDLEPWQSVTVIMKPGTIINVLVEYGGSDYMNAIILSNDGEIVRFIRDDGVKDDWNCGLDNTDFVRYKKGLEFKLRT